VNPFSYQGPVDPSRLIDRRAELDSLQSAAGDRVAIRLAAPRRFGKTSVLDAHVAAMRAVGHRAVRVDLAKVGTVGDVAARVAEAFSVLPADPSRTVRRWMGRLSVSAGVRGLRVRVGPSAWRHRKRAFYGQARPLELPRLPVAEASAHVEALLSADGLDGGSAVDELMSFTQGHPQRTVLLAHHLYNLLETPDPPADLAAAAIDLALAETRDAQQALWDGLGRVERIVCMALADGQAVSGSVLAGEHRVARSTLREALERLLGDERHVQRDGEGRPFLVDPLLAEWLKRR
jgi:hypothetical protein